MTLYEAKMVLHYATAQGDYRDGRTRGKVRKVTEKRLEGLGLIGLRPERLVGESEWVITERGLVVAARMCAVEV